MVTQQFLVLSFKVRVLMAQQHFKAIDNQLIVNGFFCVSYAFYIPIE